MLAVAIVRVGSEGVFNAVFVAIGVVLTGCVFLGKSTGDAMAAWVFANDPDEELHETFGVDWGRREPRLGRYVAYKQRYVELRRARNEPTTTAMWFEVARFTPIVAMVLGVVVGFLLTTP